jgi:hypothetical protein
MRIVALSPIVLWTFTLAGRQSKSRQSEALAGPIQRRIPGLCQGLSRSRGRQTGGSFDRNETDSRRDRTGEAKEDKDEKPGASHRQTVLHSSRKRFWLHSSRAVPL